MLVSSFPAVARTVVFIKSNEPQPAGKNEAGQKEPSNLAAARGKVSLIRGQKQIRYGDVIRLTIDGDEVLLICSYRKSGSRPHRASGASEIHLNRGPLNQGISVL